MQHLVVDIGIDSILSVGLLAYLMYFKEAMTPDFLHFVVCLGEEATHSLWIISLWLIYKCFYCRQTIDRDPGLRETTRISLILL